jgi:hypothetical protein
MTDADLRAMLLSDDPDVVLDALFVLGGDTASPPSEEILQKALACFRSGDPDVRRQAVIAVAIHWGVASAFPELLRLITSEEDEYVTESVVSAVARIARDTPGLKATALESLAGVCLAERRSLRLRSLAFVEVRRLVGRTSAQEYAAELLSPESVPIDERWLHEVVRQYAPPGSGLSE